MRFILALIVAATHLQVYAAPGWLGKIGELGAFEAILGFLVISGFSIQQSHARQPNGFYWRRALRLYPVYLGALALVVITFPDKLDLSFCGIVILNVIFLNQVFTRESLLGPAWSLSLEVWHYALTPWLSRLRNSQLLLGCACSLLAYGIYTCGRTLWHWPHFAGLGFGLNMLVLSFPWICGFLIGRGNACSRGIGLRLLGAIFFIHFALTFGIQVVSRWRHQLWSRFFTEDLPGFFLRGLTLLAVWLVFAYILSSRGSAKKKPSHLSRFLGDISYPLYLVHLPVYGIMKARGLADPALMMGSALVVSMLFYVILDAYGKNRKKRERNLKLIQSTNSA